MVLIVEKAPVDSHEEIKKRNSSVERQLGDLGSWELAISIPKFNDGLVIASGELVCEDTIIAGVLDIIFDGARVLQMDGLGRDQILGLFGGVG